MVNEKKCTKCKRIRPMNEFHKTSRKFKKKDGEIYTYEYYHAKCKVCRGLEKKAWYRAKVDALCDKE